MVGPQHSLRNQSFDRVIEQQLEAAKSVVVLWSKESVASEWVRTEAAAAVERGILVPVLIDQVKPPLEFRRRQTLTLLARNDREYDQEIKELRDHIAATLHGTALPEPALQAASPQAPPCTRSVRGPVLAIGVIAYLANAWRQNRQAASTATYDGTGTFSTNDRGDTSFRITVTLRVTGSEVSGEYSSDDGRGRDIGSLSGKLEGTSLEAVIVSNRLPGKCPLRGNLSRGGVTFKAMYQCTDGERGEFTLHRRPP